jgi:hypothetical protein
MAWPEPDSPGKIFEFATIQSHVPGPPANPGVKNRSTPDVGKLRFAAAKNNTPHQR